MNKVLLVLSAMAVLGTVHYFNIENKQFLGEQNELMQKFVDFKSKFNKKYASPEEDTIRFLIFTENYKKIEASNEKEANFKVAVNKFADLAALEFKALYLGYKKGSNIKTNEESSLNTTNLPTSVDWKSIVTPVKNQGQCGSCWAFSAVAGLEGAYALKTGTTQSFSEQQVVDCSKANDGCDGGDLVPAYEYLIKNGIQSEDSYPYTARDDKCKYTKSKVLFTPSGYVAVPTKNNDQLKAAVAQQPVPVCIEADQDVFQFYTSGVFDSDQCGVELDHCVEIVGYNDAAWVVRNSWGSDWGEAGHIQIRKDTGKSAGICGIALEAIYAKY